jgi:hypothetical protein
MQTFFPHKNLAVTARSIDPDRLVNQIREGLTLIRGGWAGHPASVMWQGHMYALGEYLMVIQAEVVRRGGKTTSDRKISDEMERLEAQGRLEKPWWVGWEPFHRSHRSNMLRKRPAWYGCLWPDETPDLPYLWPRKDGLVKIGRGKKAPVVWCNDQIFDDLDALRELGVEQGLG